MPYDGQNGVWLGIKQGFGTSIYFVISLKAGQKLIVSSKDEVVLSNVYLDIVTSATPIGTDKWVVNGLCPPYACKGPCFL